MKFKSLRKTDKTQLNKNPGFSSPRLVSLSLCGYISLCLLSWLLGILSLACEGHLIIQERRLKGRIQEPFSYHSRG
ncbi:hypothetical protein MRB53_026657 [Persea americana]|uniref:Uncharacterized protein n=1 Tax=Persea americana TaxID=3435 RepID=A0ACC2LJD0_PERAE|nr:hypothetical protein MRB53_026657 [Persea americana]